MMNDTHRNRFRCFGISYRAGFIEVMSVHPGHVNVETWWLVPDAVCDDKNWVTDAASEEISGNTEIEIDLQQALELADSLQIAVSDAITDSPTEKRCDECGSTFATASATMPELCRECAHYLYGKPNCAHSFRDGHCLRCRWDGSVSEYIASLKGVSDR